MNLSADVASSYVKSFLREMSQPIDQTRLADVFYGEDDIEELERMEVAEAGGAVGVVAPAAVPDPTPS